MVVQGTQASFLVKAMPFAAWIGLRVADCPTVVLRVAACPAMVLRVAACPTFVLRLSCDCPARPLAQDFVLRVAALSQTWLARVAAHAASGGGDVA